MTNQIGFYPFPNRTTRFQMATITRATWNYGAATMTTTIDVPTRPPGPPKPARRPDHRDRLEAHCVDRVVEGLTMGVGAPVYPVGPVVKGRRCLVVGGGHVAARKIGGLLACGAAVTVVAPEVHVAIGALTDSGAIAAIDESPLDVHIRPYRSPEAADYGLVIAATGDETVNDAVHRDAVAAGVWVNVADDPARCSFVLPAVARDGPVSIAVSTAGASPALAGWLRDRAVEALGPGSARWRASSTRDGGEYGPEAGAPRRSTGGRCSTARSPTWSARAASSTHAPCSTRSSMTGRHRPPDAAGALRQRFWARNRLIGNTLPRGSHRNRVGRPTEETPRFRGVDSRRALVGRSQRRRGHRGHHPRQPRDGGHRRAVAGREPRRRDPAAVPDLGGARLPGAAAPRRSGRGAEREPVHGDAHVRSTGPQGAGVERRRDELDRREVKLAITALGRTVVSNVIERRRAEASDILEAIPVPLRRQLVSSLTLLATAAGETPELHWGPGWY